MTLLLAFLLAGPLTAVHVAAMALASIAVGAKVKRVQLFYGPSLTLRAASPEVRLGLFPFGGYVLHDGAPDPRAPGPPYRAPAEGAPSAQPPELRPLVEKIGVARFVALLLSGNAALLALALALGGPAMLVSAARLPAQLAWLVLDHARAVDALRAFARHPRDATLVAVTAAKLAAFNLLPLPGLNGGQLAGLLVPARLRERTRGPAALAATLCTLVLAACLLDAWLRS